MSDAPSRLSSVRVWDLPARIFRWGLALTIVGLVASAKIGGVARVSGLSG